MRTLTVIEELRKNGRYRPETRVPFIRIRGRWLEQYGFKRGGKVYIHETGTGELLLTSKPPQPVFQLKPIEEIKAEFKALGIETETRTKKKQAETQFPEQIQAELQHQPVLASAKAEQSSFDLDGEPIPLEHFKPTQISAREYSKLLKEY